MRAINVSIVSAVVLMGCCCPLGRNQGFAPIPQEDGQVAEPPGKFSGEKFAFAQQVARDNRGTTTNMEGSRTEQPFRDVPAEGAFLIGFQVGLGDFVGSPIINALRPIYLTRKGEKMGPWLGKIPANVITTKARPGYVVSSIDLRVGLLLDNIQLNFARLDANRIVFSDGYRGDSIGGQGGDPRNIGGNGVLPIGIFGCLDNNGAPCSLGLIAAPLQ